MALWKEVCHWGVTGVSFKVSKAHSRPSVSLLLCLIPVDQDVQLSATVPMTCLSASNQHDDGLPSETMSKDPR